MKTDLIKAKLKASGIHLGISVMIFIGILYLILVEWYPEPFYTASGGWNGVKLLAAVDLVLGPSLTFIIFNNTKAKKEIILDLTLIAIVQISALIWGGMQVFSERPVALVMWEGIFYTVTEDYYNKQGVSLDDIAGFSEDKPLIILAETDHSVEQLEAIKRLNEQKIPPYAQVHLYQSIKENLGQVLTHQLSDDVMSMYFSQMVPDTDQHIFLGKAKYRNLLIFLDKDANLVAIKMRS